MKRLASLAAIALSFLAAACTSSPPSLWGTSGRYLQVRNPMNGVVSAQFTFPTADGCAFILKLWLKSDDGKDFHKFSACTESTASQALPFRATLRNKAAGFLYDLETASLTECTEGLSGMLKGSNRENLEVVASCKSK
ncbi:hypothetical protein LJR175_003113 [Variovorax sp. LjRoot175]|uniref:hypothetical protein n=1 Tax=Variovorax sp. LjRoot175 TaxID=3342276 RepID=UPI003ECF949C